MIENPEASKAALQYYAARKSAGCEVCNGGTTGGCSVFSRAVLARYNPALKDPDNPFIQVCTACEMKHQIRSGNRKMKSLIEFR